MNHLGGLADGAGIGSTLASGLHACYFMKLLSGRCRDSASAVVMTTDETIADIGGA